MNVNKSYIQASRFYLTDELPADFDELDEQEVMDFIKDDIWELIDDLAREFYKQTNHE